ncbi:MAG TPA: ABC transporter ATP-binding protein [Polyangia bacterium]|jgi:ABC-2 type transport system ATP-binding protein|nr:ABC transporter ATP-binding protein [Polyangia bacterium]
MTNEASVELEGVTKFFRDVPALRGLDLKVPRGCVLGLLGRNGAGKSTALRCMAGVERPDAGTVRVLGLDPLRFDVAARRRVGYLAETGVPFPAARVSRLIALCAPLYPRWNDALQDELLRRFGISPRARLKELSLGQQRAVGLLLAICPEPELLILDEPAANLDTVVRREFLETIIGLVGDGDRTVIFSSHILSDVERVADRIAVVHRGALRLEGALDDIKDAARRVRLTFAGEPPAEIALPGLVALRRRGRELLATLIGYDEAETARVAAALGAHVEAQRLGLEELFIDLEGQHGIVDRSAA